MFSKSRLLPTGFLVLLIGLFVCGLGFCAGKTKKVLPLTFTGRDGGEMVLIPADEFEMGSNDGELDEKPVHHVYVDAFYIDKYEVTNAQYAAFLNAKGKHGEGDLVWYHAGPYSQIARIGSRYEVREGYENHPVEVSWYGAMAYAAWAGKRLPTEAEWEYAARGGLRGATYPWGNTIDADSGQANYGSNGIKPVGRSVANGYGLCDMAGNVWEWCLDEYNADFYSVSPRSNPVSGGTVTNVINKFTNVKNFRVLRGGSCVGDARNVRVANRNSNDPSSHTGFRCARTVSPEEVTIEPEEEVTVAPAVPPDAKMVLIPAGDFEMGSEDAEAHVNQQPIHTVYVDAFHMDKYEVTNAQYAVFLNEMGKHSEGGLRWYDTGDRHARIALLGGRYKVSVGYENHPVTMVSWYGAMAYAAWAGKRLPTEAEWEKAARGGLVSQKYPWGNTIDIDSGQANYGSNGTKPVGGYAANGYGLYDMAGNVWEWCLDEYNESFYAVSAARNPLSGAPSIQWLLGNYTGVQSSRVLRGGSWYLSAVALRSASRDGYPPTSTPPIFGFRCVRAVSP